MNFFKVKTNPDNVIKLDVNFLKKICRVQSPSGQERNMINFIKNFIKLVENTNCVEDKYGNLLITKGELEEGEFYPCLIAHMDEVHDFNSHRIICEVDDFMFAWDKKIGKRDGIGADDKNGIYIALEMLKRFDKLKIFFSVGEEIGCVGTNRVDLKFFDNVGYMMQCDRRGSSDLIVYTNSIDVTSDEFLIDISHICIQYDYAEARGVYTDVGALKLRGVNVSGCNISCGYFDEHSENELIHLPSLENCMNFVYFILLELQTKKYPHVPNGFKIQSTKDKWDFDWNDIPLDPCWGCKDNCNTCMKFNR